MKLYYSKGSCSLAVRIILNELNLNFEEEAVNLATKKTASGRDFLAINSKGAVPTLVLDNGSILTENAVIQQYLADSQKATRLLPPINDLERYHVLEWLNYVSTEMHKTIGILFKPTFPDDVKQNVVIPLIKSKLDYVDQQLSNYAFLHSNDFTLPDGYMFVVLSWLPHFKINLSHWANVSKYFKLLQARASVVKSLEQEGG